MVVLTNVCVCPINHSPTHFLTGRIKRADSIFKYIEGTSFETFDRSDFEPLFLQEVLANMTASQRQQAQTKCNGNQECIFDYAVTGKNDTCLEWCPICKYNETHVFPCFRILLAM